MPLRNTTVIPRAFVAQHAATVEAEMTATVLLQHPAVVGPYDPALGRSPLTPATPYYQGCARVQARGGFSDGDSADRLALVGDYLVAVPIPAGRASLVNDLAVVLSNPDNPALEGQVLAVRQIPMASITLQINLGCDLQTDANPGAEAG